MRKILTRLVLAVGVAAGGAALSGCLTDKESACVALGGTIDHTAWHGCRGQRADLRQNCAQLMMTYGRPDAAYWCWAL